MAKSDPTKKLKPRARKGLTSKQKEFIKEYVYNGENGTQAALAAYDITETSARAFAAENLAKPYIKAEIDRIHGDIQEKIKRAALSAFTVIEELSQASQDERIQLAASKDILDRAGHGAVQKTAQLSQKVITLDI